MSKPDLKRLGNVLVSCFQVTALFVIGATIVWSAATEYMKMMQAGHARLDLRNRYGRSRPKADITGLRFTNLGRARRR